MLLKSLEEKLKSDHLLLDSQIVKDRQVYDLIPVTEATEYRDDVLYISDNLKAMDKTQMPANLLWCGARLTEEDALRINWIRTEPEKLAETIACARQYILDNHAIQNLRFHIMESLLHGTGLGTILNEMGDMLETSIVIMDMSGKIIANSQPFHIADSLWQESVARGYCPPFFIDHIRDVRLQHEGEEDDPAFRYCADNRIYYLSHRIYLDSELYAYAFMIQSRPEFNRLCSEMLLLIGDTVLKLVRGRSTSADNPSHMYSNLLADIFNGISSEQIQARITAGEMRFPKRMCIAMVKPRYFRGDSYVRESLMTTLNMSFQRKHMVYYHSAVVMLFGLDEKAPDLPEETLHLLDTICQQEHLIAGVSNPFGKVNSTRHYYNQAVRAIELALAMDREGNVFNYKSFSFYDIIDEIGSQRKIGFYCHPALAILRAYDSENGTQLYDLLKTYTRTGFNQNQTASELFLHRNTLSYRKQKIISLTGLDFEDMETQFLLQCSFRIDAYLEATRH